MIHVIVLSTFSSLSESERSSIKGDTFGVVSCDSNACIMNSQYHAYYTHCRVDNASDFHQPSAQFLSGPDAAYYYNNQFYPSLHGSPQSGFRDADAWRHRNAMAHDAAAAMANQQFWPMYSGQHAHAAMHHPGQSPAPHGMPIGQANNRFVSSNERVRTVNAYQHSVKSLTNYQTKKSGTSCKFHNESNTAPLVLDIEAVKNGEDSRTSLMIRNIPNKHTQQTLMNEFQRNGHGPDKIDFFYLPIDFKNKCNRGYAFVNFSEVADVVPFYYRYNGQPWKVFNSEKICVVMYARIQGKVAFLKRFERSEILGKEGKCQPLSFVTHGPNKGQREELPKPNVCRLKFENIPIIPENVIHEKHECEDHTLLEHCLPT